MDERQNKRVPATAGVALVESASAMEKHGVDFIPDDDRSSRPSDLFFVFVGSQMCFGIIVIGSLPITFGLGFWDAVSAISVGLFFGSILFGLLAPFGAKAGANGAVASGAHFGVRGRAIGTLIAIFTGVGFYSLTVWTGGEAIAAGAIRLFGWEHSPHLMALGALIIGALTVLAALYGHAMIVATERLVSYGVAAILLLIIIALWGNFDAGFQGSGELLLGSHWPTWFLCVTISAALPVSYSIFLNDYTRYIPKGLSTNSLTLAAGSGMFVGCWIALVFAAGVTTLLKSVDAPFVPGLIDIVVWWGAALLVLVGAVGSQPQGSLCLYGAGLGLQAMAPSMGRISATILLSVVSLAVVFVGIYVWDMTNMILAFLLIDQCILAPWLAINLVGYYCIMKGEYQPKDLFTFINSVGGGRYWYSNGWNRSALLAWIVGAVVGLMFIHTDYFSGPLAEMSGGVGLDWIFAGATAALVYYVLEKAKPAAVRAEYSA